MPRYLTRLAVTAVMLVAVPAQGTPIPGEVVPGSVQGESVANPVCNSTACDIIEGVRVSLPFFATAGDVLLVDPDGSISDVVRFFNDVVDTGGGTGRGTQVFVYSKPDGPNDLSPNPDVALPPGFSVNVLRIAEGPVGQATIYNANGTNYLIYSDVIPEPSSWTLAMSGLFGIFFASKLRKG